jgi:hypothetical protein
MAKKPSSPNITIIVTIAPPAKGGQRAITISGAPKGEMPEIRTGEFAARHTLLDQVYLALVKRTPLLVNTTVALAHAAGIETEDDTDEKPTDTPAEPTATEPDAAAEELAVPEEQGTPELITQSPNDSLTQ